MELKEFLEKYRETYDELHYEVKKEDDNAVITSVTAKEEEKPRFYIMFYQHDGAFYKIVCPVHTFRKGKSVLSIKKLHFIGRFRSASLITETGGIHMEKALYFRDFLKNLNEVRVRALFGSHKWFTLDGRAGYLEV